MPVATPRAMFRILSVTCLLTRKALRLIIIPDLIGNVMSCFTYVYNYYTYELQRFEYYRYCGYPTCLCMCVCVGVCLFVVFCHRVHLDLEI